MDKSLNKKLSELAEKIENHVYESEVITEELMSREQLYDVYSRSQKDIYDDYENKLDKFSEEELIKIGKMKAFELSTTLLELFVKDYNDNHNKFVVLTFNESSSNIYGLYKEWDRIAKAPYPLYLDDNSNYKVYSEIGPLSLDNSIKEMYLKGNIYSLEASKHFNPFVLDVIEKEMDYHSDMSHRTIFSLFNDNNWSIEKIVKTDEFKDICKTIDDLNIAFEESVQSYNIECEEELEF